MSGNNPNSDQNTGKREKSHKRMAGLEKSENEEVFKNLFLQSPIAIEIYEANGKLLDLNPACLELFGIQNMDEVQGFDLFADPNISAEDRTRLVQGEPISFESFFDFELVRQKELYATSRSGICYIDCQIVPIKQKGGTQTGYLAFVRDITERKQFAQAIEQSEKRFRSLIELSTDAITLIDANGSVIYESPSTQKLTGYTAEERLGRSGFELIHPDDLPDIKSTFARIFARPGHIEGAQFRSIKKDGTIWWTEGTAINLLHEPGVQAIVVNYRNITERIDAEKTLREVNEQLNNRVAEIEKLQFELRQQALRDPLTGLYNRRYLADVLDRELARVTREKKPMSIIIMDIDHFKKVNDTHGHQVGDQFLKMIANLIAGHSRTSDIACRYGGEEFLLVMPGTSLSIAAMRAEELRVRCSSIRIPHGSRNLEVSMSMGVASYPKHGSTAEEIVIKADKALYWSKQNGRNRVSIWTEVWEK